METKTFDRVASLERVSFHLSVTKLRISAPAFVLESCIFSYISDNVKALYRRAKAHVGAWNPEEAKLDFARVIELDSSLTGLVNKELKSLEDMKKEKDLKDKEKLKGLFS